LQGLLNDALEHARHHAQNRAIALHAVTQPPGGRLIAAGITRREEAVRVTRD
jgi:hypothetical protein